MTSITVDPGVLAADAGNLTACGTRVEDVAAAVAQALTRAGDAAGPGTVPAAARAAGGRWHAALAAVASGTAELGRALHGAATGYADAESAGASAFRAAGR